MVVVEHEHQFGRKRPHPVVHHHRIVDVELPPVIDPVERVVEIDRGLRRELRHQTHVAALGQGVLRLLEQVAAERTERVEMEPRVRIRLCKVDRMLRAAETAVVAAIEQFALAVGEIEERSPARFDAVQRHDIEIDVGDLSQAGRHFAAQNAFGLNSVVFRRIAHHDEQVVGRGIAVRRAADQFPE